MLVLSRDFDFRLIFDISISIKGTRKVNRRSELLTRVECNYVLNLSVSVKPSMVKLKNSGEVNYRVRVLSPSTLESIINEYERVNPHPTFQYTCIR